MWMPGVRIRPQLESVKDYLGFQSTKGGGDETDLES